MKTHAELYPGVDAGCPGVQAPIEPGVQPLCDALNALPDTYTLWSCEGHPETASTPFVTFIAPQETAFKLSKIIECSPFLKFNWTMSAWFREDGALQYTVRPDDSRLIRKGIVGWWPRMQWSYAEMCVELINFARLVTHRLGGESDQQNDDFQIMKITKKPIFPNAKPMDKDQEDRLVRRAIVYSFTLGLFRPENVKISIYILFAGFALLNFIILNRINNLFGNNLWLSTGLMFLEMIYLSYFAVLIYQITGSRDPEKILKD